MWFIKQISMFIMLTLLSTQLWAGDYYVKTTGTKVTGASIPGDWSDGNCYEAIETALSAAGESDRVFLFKEIHILGAARAVTCYFANQDDDEDYSSCVVEFAPGAYLRTNSNIADTQIKGITFQNQVEGNGRSCIMPLNKSGKERLVSIVHCAFLKNKGKNVKGGYGSAIYFNNTNGKFNLIIDHCIFNGNEARSGGALFIKDNTEFTISNSHFYSNFTQSGQSGGQGGALLIVSRNIQSGGIITNCTFNGNKSGNEGGAIMIKDAVVNISNCTVTNNEANYEQMCSFSSGGGISVKRTIEEGSDITFICENTTFSSNCGFIDFPAIQGDGGGLKLWGKGPSDQVVFIVTGCVFKNNYASQGGGLYAGRYSRGEINRCVFAENTACSNGGASYRGGVYEDCLGETTTYNDCVFVGNQAGYTQNGEVSNGSGMGGAIGSRLYARIECFNCSFINNRSGGRQPRGDSIFLWDASGSFDSDDKRSDLVDCTFYNTNGKDVQIRSDANGFKSVDYCAYESGEFACSGFSPTNTVLLGKISSP